MSLIGFSASNHPQQTDRRGADVDTDDRRTPDYYWQPLHAVCKFTLDAAATEANTKLPRFCRDGLAEAWSRERVWCNPPYSSIRPWVEKAHAEWKRASLIAMLLPANRTEQSWWQDLVEPYRDSGDFHTRFLRSRMRFGRPGWVKPAKGDRPPFGLVLLLWTRSKSVADQAKALDGRP